LEINPAHPLIINLNHLRKTDTKEATLVSRQLLDTIFTQANLPYNVVESVDRQYNLIENYLDMLLEGTE